MGGKRLRREDICDWGLLYILDIFSACIICTTR